jgi:hypothetical protein
LLVRDAHRGDRDVDELAVLALAEALEPNGPICHHGIEDPGHILLFGHLVVRDQKVRRSADGLLRGVAEDILGALVPRLDAAPDGIVADDGIRRGRHDRREAGVGLLGLLALVDVERDPDPEGDLSGRIVSDRLTAGHEPAVLAV